MARERDRNVSDSEIQVVSSEQYRKLKKELTVLGYQFFSIRPVTVRELLEDDKYREVHGQEKRFETDGVTTWEKMLGNRPPEVEVAIKVSDVPIKRGNGLDTEKHRVIIDEERVMLRENLSPDLRNLVNVNMPTHASIAVQLIEQLDALQIGNIHVNVNSEQYVPVKNWFFRTEDQIHDGGARVGRYDGDKGIRIRGRDSRTNVNDVEVVAVVYLPRSVR